MTSTATLATLIELAETRKQQAAQAFSLAVAAHARARERLVLIERYRDDYEARQRGQTGVSIEGTLIGNTTRFIRQIAEAVAQQQAEVEHCAQHLNTTRIAFFDEERKLKSLEILVQRENRRQQTLETRRDQQQIDEFASRVSVGASTGYAL